MAIAASLLATGVSAVFAVQLLGRYAAGGRRNHALKYWGAALVLFSLASAMLVVGAAAGWSPLPFRLFYLFGAVLNVPVLALGSVMINARSAGTRVAIGVSMLVTGALFVPAAIDGSRIAYVGAALGLVWGLLVTATRDEDGLRAGSVAILAIYTAAATFAVLSAGFREQLGHGLPSGADVFDELVRSFAVGGNAVGSVAVIVGAVAAAVAITWSSTDDAQRRDLRAGARGAPLEALARFILAGVRSARAAGLTDLVAGNLLIALGVLIAAGSGRMFSFLGEMTGHAVGLGIGVVVMELGFLRTVRRRRPGGADPADTVTVDEGGATWR